jgi:hypothetical protein
VELPKFAGGQIERDAVVFSVRRQPGEEGRDIRVPTTAMHGEWCVLVGRGGRKEPGRETPRCLTVPFTERRCTSTCSGHRCVSLMSCENCAETQPMPEADCRFRGAGAVHGLLAGDGRKRVLE